MKRSVLGKETSLCEGPEGGSALGLSELPQAEHLAESLREQVGQEQTAGVWSQTAWVQVLATCLSK